MLTMVWPDDGPVLFEVAVPHENILNLVSVTVRALLAPGAATVIIGDNIESNDIGDLTEIRDALESLSAANRIVVYDVLNYVVPELNVIVRHKMTLNGREQTQDLAVPTRAGQSTSSAQRIILV